MPYGASTSTVQSGVATINANATNVVVTYPSAFSGNAAVVPTVIGPNSAAGFIGAVVDDTTRSTTGFTATLTDAAPSGYKLGWIASL